MSALDCRLRRIQEVAKKEDGDDSRTREVLFETDRSNLWEAQEDILALLGIYLSAFERAPQNPSELLPNEPESAPAYGCSAGACTSCAFCLWYIWVSSCFSSMSSRSS